MIGRKNVIAELKKLSEPKTADLDSESFAWNVRNESDRGAIMLAATMVDDALRERLEAHFSFANKDDRKTIFGFEGAVGTFSRRILIAKSVGVIDEGLRKFIDVLRHMRNACAHAQNDLNFDSPAIRAAFGLLIEASDPPISSMPRQQCRDLFVMSCAAVSAQIRVGEMSAETIETIIPFLKVITRGAPLRWSDDLTREQEPDPH